MSGGSEADGRPPSREGQKYRDFARWVGDRETVQRILAPDSGAETESPRFGKTQRRKNPKARQGNLGREQPASWKDEEFWFQAEREFREAEDLTNEIRDDI